MSPTTCELTGVIRGQTIELTTPPGLPEGEEVRVVLLPKPAARAWGEGILKSAGALADVWTEEDDRILEEIYQSRKSGKPRTLPS